MMRLLTILALATTLAGQEPGRADKPELRIKSSVMVRGLHVRIGDLCDIAPLDASTQAIADVRFGPAPLNGFSRTVSRTDVIRSLAAAGVPIGSVQLAGVDEVIVQGLSVDVPQQLILDAAATALQAQLEIEGADAEFEQPTNLRRVQAPPGRISQDLIARVRNTKTNLSSAVVDVELRIDDEVFRKIPVRFKLQRYHRVLKTVAAIQEHTPLGPENVALVREPMAQLGGHYLTRMDQVLGMNAKRRLAGNRMLTLGDIEPPAVIHKGDIVTVVLTRGRVKVTTRALANHDAPLGERIQLTNRDSRSLINGIVHAPGLVVVPN